MNKVLNFVRRTITAIKSYQLTQIKLKLKFIDLSFAPSTPSRLYLSAFNKKRYIPIGFLHTQHTYDAKLVFVDEE